MLPALLAAQNYVHQVIVVNEGQYDYANEVQLTPVSFGTFDPANNTYTHISDIANVRFASDVEVDDQNIYIAADTLLLTFDRDTYQAVSQTTIKGIRKIALWNDQVLLTRGEYGGFDHYFEARDRDDLSLVYMLDSISGPQYSGEGIAIDGDIAYLAINNGFDWGNYVGRLGMVDLIAQSYNGYTDLGMNGTNPENVMISNGAVYTLNNKDFTGSSISKVNISNGVNEYTDDVASGSSCGTSAIVEDVVYYQEYAVDKLARFNVMSQTIVDTLVNSLSYYGMVNDEINGVIYATSTDFVSSGDLHVMQHDGIILSTIAVGVSPGNLALDVRMNIGVEELSGQYSLSISPNPTNGVIKIQSEKMIKEIAVIDASGRVLISQKVNNINVSIDITDLESGVYFVRSEIGSELIVERVMRQ